jgi:hypothetical protein
MSTWRIDAAGIRENGSTQFIVRSRGGMRFLFTRVLIIFGLAKVVIIRLNLVLRDS